MRRYLWTGAGIPHLAKESHIGPVMIRDPVKTRMLSNDLMDEWGIYVQPINYPAVPRGTERLRFTPSPLHFDADMTISSRRSPIFGNNATSPTPSRERTIT